MSFTESGRSFSPDDFLLGLGLSGGASGAISVSALPSGKLTFDGQEIGEGFSFSLIEAPLLRYEPRDNETDFFTVTLQNETVTVNLVKCDATNSAPDCENLSLETVQSVSLIDTLPAFDSDGDKMTVNLLSSPQKGTLSFTGTDYTYSPYPNESGRDRFSYVITDCFGNYSPEYTVTIKIGEAESKHYYSDMTGKSGYMASVKLSEEGILAGEQIGSLRLFYPDRGVGIGELMVVLSDVTGKNSEISPTLSTGLSSDPDTEDYLKPYIKAALSDGIITDFSPDKTLTKKEAYSYAAKILELSDEADLTSDVFPNIGEIDSEYISDYMRLFQKGYITLSDIQNPNTEFNRNDLARLVYNIISE